ncbi:MAG: hypothetical protein ACD_76C00028G0001 [uncultured bacterium]|nr:MAG: hypothetical protein ACD_76C00028G0001 [uncultured bacterium]
MVACLGFMYIIQINISATKGFAIRDLEKRISTSKLENEQLESKLAELQSMDNIASKVSMLGMVPVDRIDYYSSVSSSFALNE